MMPFTIDDLTPAEQDFAVALILKDAPAADRYAVALYMKTARAAPKPAPRPTFDIFPQPLRLSPSLFLCHSACLSGRGGRR